MTTQPPLRSRPAIPAADRAPESGDAPSETGPADVAKYVEFMRHLERLHTTASHGHDEPPSAAGDPRE